MRMFALESSGNITSIYRFNDRHNLIMRPNHKRL
jgi:hypothetical protein